MIPDDQLDRILGAQTPSLDESDAFVVSVLAAVHDETSAPPPIPFPWRRAAAGVLTCALTAAAAAAGGVPRFDVGGLDWGLAFLAGHQALTSPLSSIAVVLLATATATRLTAWSR